MEWQLWWRTNNYFTRNEDALVIYNQRQHELVLVLIYPRNIDVKLNEISSNELFYSLFSGKKGPKITRSNTLSQNITHSNIK